MNTINVITTPSSLSISSSGMITGRIFFVFGNMEFPSRDWDDFVVVLLGWWLSTMSDLVSGSTHEAQLRFMDGPYMAQLKSNEDGEISLQFLARDTPVHDSIQIDGSELLAGIVGASVRVLAACDDRGWHSEDIDSLRRQVAGAKSVHSTKIH